MTATTTDLLAPAPAADSEPVPLRATVDSTELRRIVRVAAVALPRHPVVPASAAILLTGGTQGGSAVTAAASDLDLTARAHATAPRSKGAAAVEGRLLVDIVKTVPAGVDVVLRGHGDVLQVVAGELTYRLPTFPVDEVLAPGSELEAAHADVDGSNRVSGMVPASDLVLLKAVLAAAGGEKAPYLLRGVLLRCGDGARLRLSATDRFRLTDVDVAGVDLAVDDHTPAGGWVVPAGLLRAALAVHDTRATHRGAVHLALRVQARGTIDGHGPEWRVGIGGRGFELTMPTVDGTYPKVDSLWKDTTGCFAIDVDPAALAAAVRQVQVVLRGAPVGLQVEHGQLHVGTPAAGDDAEPSASTKVPARISQVPPLGDDRSLPESPVWANPGFLLDALRTAPPPPSLEEAVAGQDPPPVAVQASPLVRMYVPATRSERRSPVTFVVPGRDDWRHLLMPTYSDAEVAR